jgi:hypothetical protein
MWLSQWSPLSIITLGKGGNTDVAKNHALHADSIPGIYRMDSSFNC